MEAWLCVFCSKISADLFCLCDPAGLLLCYNCFGLHFAKTPTRSHTAHPIGSYAYRHIPGYFDRLQQRTAALPQACEELRKNLSAIDRAIEALHAKARTVIEGIQEYVQTETETLQRLKEQMRTDIDAAVAEAERTVFEDSPVLESKYGRAMQGWGGDSSKLSLFVYQVRATVGNCKHIIELIYTPEVEKKHLEKVRETSKCPSSKTPLIEESFTLFPGICNNSVQCHNLASGQVTSFTLPVSFSTGTTFCLLGACTVLCVGSSPPSTAARLLTLSTAAVTDLQPTLLPHYFSGAIKHSSFVYLFGGKDARAAPTHQCEKFSLGSQGWMRLSDMHYPRASFSPCVHEQDIYLLDVAREYRTLEVFSVRTEEFKVLPVVVPKRLENNSVSFIAEGELVVLTCRKQIGRWRINARGRFKVSSLDMNNEYSGLSNIPPVGVGKLFYWARFDDGALVKFDTSTNALID